MLEVLFQYGPITVRTINLFIALSFLVGMIFLLRYIASKKMNVAFLANHFLFLILSSAIGGRLLQLLENLEGYKTAPLKILYIWDFKFSIFGILFGGIFALYILTKQEKENFWSWLDAFSLASMAGLPLVHIGHFFNGSNYGNPSDLPWAIAFDTLGIPFLNPIHPTQLYSALIGIFLLIIGLKYSKRTHLPGIVANLIIMLYSVGALGVDFLHGDPSNYHKISYLTIAAISFTLLIHCSHQKLQIKN